MKKMVLIQTCQESENPSVIGQVSPPAKMQKWTDARLAKEIDRLWDKWRWLDPTPDCDSEFIGWLKDNGWTEHEPPLLHAISV